MSTVLNTTSAAFAKARAENRAALVGYLPAGFPDLDGSIEALKVMVEHGCDIIEIGLPYTDPVMDGPIIQAAAQQALDNGTRTKQVLQVVEAVAATGAPTLVMTYWGPIERYRGGSRGAHLHGGVAQFAADLANAGGAGMITPDITPDFGQEWIAAADAHGLDKVFLVAPSSTPERIAMTTAASRGFVYATGVMGVTGGKQATGDIVRPLIERTKATTNLPVGVGVGVSTGEQAALFAQYADGVIVGSAFVRTLLEAPDRATGLRNLAALTEELAAGVRRG